MKIAFIILAHKHPEQTVRLVDSLGSIADRFLIHIDQRSGTVFDQTQRLLNDAANVLFVEQRSACRWGQFSIVNATLTCLRYIYQQPEKYDYVFLISGQCYPIKPVAEIKQFLETHQGQQFIEAFPILEPNQWTEQGGPYQAARRVFNWHFFVRSRHLHLPLQRTMPNGLVPYGGSQWWAITGDCGQYLLNYLEAHPEVLNYFKYTFIPDELFFQTLVCNSPFKTAVSNFNLTYTDWSNPNPTPPRVLGVEDFAALQTSDCLFARKFDPDRSEKLLALIDKTLLAAVQGRS